MMKPSRRSGERSQNCTEPVGILHREVRVPGQATGDIGCIRGIGHRDLQTEPLVDYQPIILPLIVDCIRRRLAMPRLQ